MYRDIRLSGEVCTQGFRVLRVQLADDHTVLLAQQFGHDLR